jgi:hypothetical protein
LFVYNPYVNVYCDLAHNSTQSGDSDYDMPTGGNATIYSKFPTNVISDIVNDAELSYNGNWSSGGGQLDGFANGNGTTNPGRGGWDYIFRPNGKFNYNSPNAWSREPDYFANSKMPATYIISIRLDT